MKIHNRESLKDVKSLLPVDPKDANLILAKDIVK